MISKRDLISLLSRVYASGLLVGPVNEDRAYLKKNDAHRYICRWAFCYFQVSLKKCLYCSIFSDNLLARTLLAGYRAWYIVIASCRYPSIFSLFQ